MQKSAAGMDRFFSSRNLGRYRTLASGGIGQAEQHQLLEDLAEEMNALRSDAGVAAVNRRSEFKESLGSQGAGQI
jgi:hypothetical protein